MKNIRFRFLAAALAVMLGAAISKAQTADTPAPPPMHHRGMRMDGPMGFFAEYLALTDAQKAQMKEVLQKERPTMKPLHQQLHQLDQQLKQYTEGTYDEAKVQGLVAQQSQALVQMKVEEARIHSELYQLLTPEQQTKMKEFEANREARMQKHMQNASDSQSSEPQQ